MLKSMLHIIVLILIFSTSFFSQANTCNSIKIPINFNERGLPHIELEINTQKINALLDLGSSAGIHLPKIILSKISDSKDTGSTKKSFDLAGNITESKIFNISSLQIKCLSFKNINALELKPWGLSIGKDKKVSPKRQAVVGRGFFKGKIISINYKEKQMTVYNDQLDIKNNWSLFTSSKEGITLIASSKLTDYNMVLDTGASASIIKYKEVNDAEDFEHCNYDLGSKIECKLLVSQLKILNYPVESSILLYPLEDRFGMHGLLGSDFFNQFVVDLNFKNNTIRITPVTPKLSK